jgi:hypothetical protein
VKFQGVEIGLAREEFAHPRHCAGIASPHLAHQALGKLLLMLEAGARRKRLHVEPLHRAPPCPDAGTGKVRGITTNTSFKEHAPGPRRMGRKRFVWDGRLAVEQVGDSLSADAVRPAGAQTSVPNGRDDCQEQLEPS